MKRLNITLAMALAAGCAVAASAQIAPLDKAKDAAARSTAASAGTPEQQQAINMQDSKPAPPPSQAVHGGAMGTAVSPKKGAAAKASPMAKKAKVPTPEEIRKLADQTDKAEAGKPAPELDKRAGDKRRDPFVSPVVRAAAAASADCRAGKRCLSPSDMALRGIVKAQNGWTAVVVNSAGRTYFLHERDEIFNGVVEKITGDTVVIREQTLDNLGKTSTHQVVKKLSPA